MDYAGWYLFTLRTVTVASVPVLGELQTVTESVMVVQLEAVEGGLAGKNSICDITIEGSTELATTTLPDAFVRSVPTGRYTLVLGEDGEGRTTIAGDLAEVHVGYDPSAGGVPRSPEDPQERDTDGDGKPGSTVVVEILRMGSYDIYVAQRSQVHVEGTWDGERFTGASDLPVMEQSVLGSEHPLLTRAPLLGTATGTFVLEPLPGPSTCRGLGLTRPTGTP